VTVFDHPARRLQFNADVYMMRALPQSGCVIINHGYAEIRVVDCIRGIETAQIALPEPDFAVYKCFTGGDGTTSYLFSQDDQDYLVAIDLKAATSRKIDLAADIDVPTGLCWFDPSFTVLDCKEHLWSINGNSLAPTDINLANTIYTSAHRQMNQQFVVHKTAGSSTSLYVRSRRHPVPKVGFLDVATGVERLFSDRGQAIDFVSHEAALFIAFDTKIIRYENGTETEVLRADDDHAYLAVEIVEADSDSYLCVLSATKDYLYGPVTAISAYKLRQQRSSPRAPRLL
jgi:hypothetical protein